MDESRRKKGRYTDMQRIITQVISNCVMNNDAIWMAGWVPYQFKIVFKDSNYPQIQWSTGSCVCVYVCVCVCVCGGGGGGG